MANAVTVTFLGGLGEIGRNCCAIEVDGDMILIDFGLMFPGPDMPGIDLVLPDFSYIVDNVAKLRGVVLTHGHEDHVGGLPFLLREVSVPLYGARFTLGLARNRIEEAGLLGRTSFNVVEDGGTIQIGNMRVEFIPITHSVPSGSAIAVHTPQGIVLHSGDFKLDATPVDGRRSDLARIGHLSHTQGIRLLLADSTNADEPGWSTSESEIGRVLYDLFHEHQDRRLVVACFSSHIHRIQQIADAAIEQGRVVATLGLSMQRNVRMAREMGLLDLPESKLIDINEIDRYEPHKVCVISTGSQGEPMSALTLMAANQNRRLKVGPDDTVILSSSPIPGNEHNVSKVIDGLSRMGVEVVHSGIADVHASGHAQALELQLYHSLVKPEWFIPVHGEYRQMVAHGRIAEDLGIADGHVVICEDGDQVTLDDRGVARTGRVSANYVFVDGIVGDVGRGVLRDRRLLAEEGVVVVIVTVDVHNRSVVTDPQIITRGWVYAPEAEDLLDEGAEMVRREVLDALASGTTDPETIQQRIRRATGQFVHDRTKRKPMIVPVVLEL
ncbi:MAG: ribonuclease J [Acidimicrobiales bacterium]